MFCELGILYILNFQKKYQKQSIKFKMNITGLKVTNSNATSEIVLALDLDRDIIMNYGSRGILMIGIPINLFGLLVLQNKRRLGKKKFYDFLFCRFFCNLVVCLLGCLHNATKRLCQTLFEAVHSFACSLIGRIVCSINFQKR